MVTAVVSIMWLVCVIESERGRLSVYPVFDDNAGYVGQMFYVFRDKYHIMF